MIEYLEKIWWKQNGEERVRSEKRRRIKQKHMNEKMQLEKFSEQAPGNWAATKAWEAPERAGKICWRNG